MTMSNILDCNLAFFGIRRDQSPGIYRKILAQTTTLYMQDKLLVSFAINFIIVCNEEPSAGDLES